MSQNQEIVLQVKNLSKSFAGIKALEEVQLELHKGEVHALMGENGAGKSTLMNILMGLLSADAGEIIFEGETLIHSNVSQSLKKGISMIHQELLVVPELTVAQNIFLGQEQKKSFWVNDSSINQKAQALLDRIGVNINAKTKIKNISVAEMQMVEIAKALSNNAKIIIMDEPTSAISDKEVATLFQIINDLKAKGVAIVYISHKMDEIFEIADRITVLRDGKYIGTKKASELDRNSLIKMMVGREIENIFPQSELNYGNEALLVKNLTKIGQFENINFEVKTGEILGISGLMGAGRTEIARVIYGLDKPTSGDVLINGQSVKIKSPKDAISAKIGYVSEDRKGLGFIPTMSVKQNISLTSLPKYSNGWFVKDNAENDIALQMIQNLQIKVADANQKVVNLSGGNQQKVVIAKVLLASPEILILDEPTRGIDVGAKFEIYKLIRELASKGIAIILISSELPEILGLSDRVLVISKGKQTAILLKSEATQESIMHFAMID